MLGLGGIAAWTVDLDDFSNRCCSEAFPLLSSINRVFNRISTPKPVSGSNCQKPFEPVTPVAPVTTTVGPDGIPGPGLNEHTTWPSWSPSNTTPKPSSSEYTWWPTQSTTTTTTTTEAPTTTTTTTTTSTEKPDEEIIHVPVNTIPGSGGSCTIEGRYKRHPYSCSKYYQCVYSEYIEYNCASGLHWHERGNLCDWPASAKCVEKTPSSDEIVTKKPITSTTIAHNDDYTTEKLSTTRKPTVTNRPTTPKPYNKPISPSEPCTNGTYRSNIDDCESYFICVNHKWIRQDCGYGFQFDQTSLECDYASRVRCLPASRYLKFVGKLSRVQLDDPCEGRDYVVSIFKH